MCGMKVDQAIVACSADVDSAQNNEIQIERFDLAQQMVQIAKRRAQGRMMSCPENAYVKSLLARRAAAHVGIPTGAD